MPQAAEGLKKAAQRHSHCPRSQCLYQIILLRASGESTKLRTIAPHSCSLAVPQFRGPACGVVDSSRTSTAFSKAPSSFIAFV